jgi:cell division protein FtsA
LALLNKIVDSKKEVSVLDLGTTKACCAVASKVCCSVSHVAQRGLDSTERLWQINRENVIRVLGVGCMMSKGIKIGGISNLCDLEESILEAIAAAEDESDRTIKSIFVSVPTWSTSSCRIETSIDLGNLPVDETHINSMLEFDSHKCMDKDFEVIHVFPISYSLDGVKGIQNPVGMLGKKLSATLYVMSANKSFIENARNCMARNSIDVAGFVSSTYVSGLSVLTEEEVSSGVTLIDIGGGSTSIAYFYEGTLLYLDYVPVGGQSITDDIATVLRTSKSNAERLKILYGTASVNDSSKQEQIMVPKIDEYGEEFVQNVSKDVLDDIIYSRMEEILELTRKRICGSGADHVLFRKIVVTGGGSRVSGLPDLMAQIFKNSIIRLGRPIGVKGSHDFVKSSSFASVAGTLVYCACQFLNSQSMRWSHSKKSLFQKLITWFKRGI